MCDNLSSVSLAEFKAAQNWQAQYRLIMQWGSLIQTKPEVRHENNQVKGCEASAWLTHECINQVHYFTFDSDSRLIKGLVALILMVLNGKTTDEFLSQSMEIYLQDLNLQKHLTPSRANGLNRIIKKMQDYVTASSV